MTKYRVDLILDNDNRPFLRAGLATFNLSLNQSQDIMNEVDKVRKGVNVSLIVSESQLAHFYVHTVNHSHPAAFRVHRIVRVAESDAVDLTKDLL